MTELFRHFTRILFSRNFAYAKFRENLTLAKISEFTVFTYSFVMYLVTSIIFLVVSMYPLSPKCIMAAQQAAITAPDLLPASIILIGKI